MSLSMFHLHQMLLVSINKLLAEFWLDIWPPLLAELTKLTKFIGCLAWTWPDVFSVALRLGLWGKRSKHLIIVRYSHCKTSFAICLGSLSYWNTQLRPCFNPLANDLRLYWTIMMWSSFFIIPSTLCKTPVPLSAKQPNNSFFPLV